GHAASGHRQPGGRPAENSRPWAASTTTRASRASSAAAQASASAPWTSGSRRFPAAGRSSVSHATPSRSANRTAAGREGVRGGDPLPPLEVGEADHRRLLDAGMRLQDRLDLGGRDVLAPANDHVVLAAGDEEIALLVPPPHVTRREPAVAERRLGASRVSLHD